MVHVLLVFGVSGIMYLVMAPLPWMRFVLYTCSNEREGIPVDLIHMLDDCVEIPQFGVIRSLNVHVSGALLVWEYTKQHMFGHEEC